MCFLFIIIIIITPVIRKQRGKMIFAVNIKMSKFRILKYNFEVLLLHHILEAKIVFFTVFCRQNINLLL